MSLNLTQLLSLIEEMPAYRQLVQELLGQINNIKVAVLDAAKPYLIAALYHTQQQPILVVTAQPENSKKLYEQLLTWCNSTRVKLLPEPDTLPCAQGNAARFQRQRCILLWLSPLPQPSCRRRHRIAISFLSAIL